jgi:uncharacterized protein (TIGR03086 family)
MADLPDLHEKALTATRAVVANVASDQWSAPTPCGDWDVREVVNHIVGGNWWVAPLLSGHTIADVGDRLDGDVLGDDPLAAYDQSAGEADAVFHRPDAMAAPANVSYGPVPGEVYCGHRFLDVLIHGWDVAKATGQHTDLPDELVEGAWEVVRPQLDLLKASGMFGTEMAVPDDAASQVKLLAVLGREA